MLEAQQDLATRLGVLKSEIKPVSGVQETWDDASLGCPQAGVTYLAGKVTGWVLTLRHGTRDYTYHTDMSAHDSLPCNLDRVTRAASKKGPSGRNRTA